METDANIDTTTQSFNLLLLSLVSMETGGNLYTAIYTVMQPSVAIAGQYGTIITTCNLLLLLLVGMETGGNLTDITTCGNLTDITTHTA